jgi:PAS domain S-box-containing protein
MLCAGGTPTPEAVLMDVTDRSSEAQLRQSRELLRITLTSIGDAVITTDIEGRITFLNPVAESVTGWTHEEALGQPLEIVFHIINEQTRQPAENPATRALREGFTVGLANHTILISKDGTARAIDDSASPIKSEQGDVVGCVLIFRDITERRRLEQENARRLQATRLLAVIVDSSTDAIISKTLDGTIISWNAAAERLLGYTAAEAIGRNISLIIPAERRAEEAAIIARLRAGERIEHFDTVRVKRDGQSIDVSLTISPIRDEAGQVVGASKIMRDISERKRAEEALRDSERRLAMELTAVTRMQQVSTRLVQADDFPALLTEILEAAIEITGADMGNIQLLEGGVLKIVSQRGFDAPFLDFFNVVRESEGTCGTAMQRGARVIVEDITTSPVFAGTKALDVLLAARVRAVQSTPLVSRIGRMLGIFSTHYHAPQRPGERELRLLDVLARQAADSIERMQADLALREADRRKDEFLAMLGHELRNPLAAVRNAVAIASLDETRRTPALDIARRQVEQLGRLVDDLLDVARITQGRILLRKERVYLAPIIERAIESIRSFIESRGLHLAVAFPSEPIRIEADPARLEQVFLNLLSNAGKYTNVGGRIDVITARDGDDAVVRIRDTGIGIAAEMLPRLWDLFAQADRSLDRRQGGLGVGLTIARRLIEQHGARIEAHSEGVGKGAEFVVIFPALPARTEDALGPAPTAPTTQRRARILVVEDNPDAADSLMMLLELLGHRVRVAYDGIAALELARANVPDVMLIDIGLPGMDGHEVARRVRRDPALKDIVLVAMTGYGREEDKREALTAGFDYHLVKPVDPDALHGLVAQLGKDDPNTPRIVH